MFRSQSGANSMAKKIHTWTAEELEKYCKEHDIPVAPDDDPIYSEGPSIMFLPNTLERLREKDTDPTRETSQSDSDIPPKKGE
jgi:hypothetical protein